MSQPDPVPVIAAPHAADAPVAHQFDDAAQQRNAATLGMWIFLATEILFFGGMFLAYTVYRYRFPEDFRHASAHTLIWVGTINTAILLLSSFTMVLAVRASELRNRVAAVRLLCATAGLGALFLLIKAFEYRHEIAEGLLPGSLFHFGPADGPAARLFFYIYFLMTGVHALHVAIGVVLLGGFALRAHRTRNLAGMATSIDLLGLYWHFVDVVWVFLFPLIYLIGRHA